MSADELRARFSGLAEQVVPMEDPHGRLMVRRRRRFRARIASLATVTAAVVTGGIALPTSMVSFGARPELPPEMVIQSARPPSGEEYLERLVNAPVRGNLSDDKSMIAEVQKLFGEFGPNVQGAKDPSVLFLNRTERMLQTVVVYKGGDQPIAVARATQPEGSVKDLLSDPAGSQAPLTPFLVMPVSDYSGKMKGMVGLAPPGCSIEVSGKGMFNADGTWSRSYQPEPTGDYVVRDYRMVNELWRVGCDGRVREVRIADDYLDSVGVESNATTMYDRVVRFSGAAPNKGTVQWRGFLPGLRSEATLVSPLSVPGPAMLAIGPFPKALLVTDVPEKAAAPSPSMPSEEWSMVALGIAGDGINVVRVPQPRGDRSFLGNEVFVHTDTNAIRVEALDSNLKVVTAAPMSNGVGILTFSPGVAETIRTVNSRGIPTSSIRFVELVKGARVLGDQLFKDW